MSSPFDDLATSCLGHLTAAIAVMAVTAVVVGKKAAVIACMMMMMTTMMVVVVMEMKQRQQQQLKIEAAAYNTLHKSTPKSCPPSSTT